MPQRASSKTKRPELAQAVDSVKQAAQHVRNAMQGKIDEARGAATAELAKAKATALKSTGAAQEKVESVLEHVAEGCGVRQTGRLCRVAPNTVARYSRIAGEHAETAHDELVELSPPDDRGPVR